MKYIVSILLVILLNYLTPSPIIENKLEEFLTEPEPLPIEKPLPEEIILETMTFEEKVGQLFIFGFDGTTLDPQNKQFLQDSHIGGVLLLGRNILNEEQLIQLIQDIQSTNRVPLFISIDQEGGIVSRLKWNDTLTKPQHSTNTLEEAYIVAKSRGELLKNYGINMNLAPVVEYITDSNSFLYNRVYRGTKEDVYQRGIATIEGYNDSGIISVPKHYPGHSNTALDSHHHLPVVEILNNQWNEYIEPFSKILEATKVSAIMVGHIKYPNIDNNPATLSYELITNRLVKGLNFNGLVISDDMEMNALDNIDSYTNIAKQALLAGNDILIYSMYDDDDSSIQKDVYEYILNDVKNGNLNIDQKILKILKIKIEYGILNSEEFNKSP